MKTINRIAGEFVRCFHSAFRIPHSAFGLTWVIVSVAVAATVLNALKPPVIDDPAYLAYASEFAKHPERPYDFTYYEKQANSYLVPPVFPAWLAIGSGIVGNDPTALKLWLFPLLLLFTASLYALLQRFAPKLALPLTIMTVFSPAILPSINLMLDIPVLAFALAAVVLYLTAFDKQSIPLALLAGLLAGLAMETKYNAFTLPGVFLAHAWVSRRWRMAFAASIAVVGFFAGCEALIASIHGDSHFVLAMHGRGQQQNKFLPVRLLAAAVALSGGLASIIWLIGLTAMNVSKRIILALLAMIGLGYVLLMLVPAPFDVFVRDPDNGRPLLILNHLVFVPLGLAFLATLIVAGRRLYRNADNVPEQDKALDKFLVLWLGIEFAGFMLISPFPAVRRLLSLYVSATVVFGRAASRGAVTRERVRLIQGLSMASVALGLAYYAIEVHDAEAEQIGFRRSLAAVYDRDPNAKIRFHGTWGTMYRAEREGLEWTHNVGEDLRPGEWFIHDIRDGLPIHPSVLPDLELVERIDVSDDFPLATQCTFYANRTPIVHFEGARLTMNVYRYQPKASNPPRRRGYNGPVSMFVNPPALP